MIELAILTAIRRRLDAALTRPQPARSQPMHALQVDGMALGRFDAGRMARLESFANVFRRRGEALEFVPGLGGPGDRTAALDDVAHALAAEGALTAWRNERYAVAAAFDAPPAFHLERAAARYFGIQTYAAHANGLVMDAAAPRMWLARRSATKAIDPSQLDNLVGGGIAAGESPDATLVREAWEEAGIPAGLARQARRCMTIDVERHVHDGYQRETIFAYDLWLPGSFVPLNQDGEAVEHRCVDFTAAARLMANTEGPDVLTLDATAVAYDCLRRHGATQPLPDA